MGVRLPPRILGRTNEKFCKHIYYKDNGYCSKECGIYYSKLGRLEITKSKFNIGFKCVGENCPIRDPDEEPIKIPKEDLSNNFDYIRHLRSQSFNQETLQGIDELIRENERIGKDLGEFITDIENKYDL